VSDASRARQLHMALKMSRDRKIADTFASNTAACNIKITKRDVVCNMKYNDFSESISFIVCLCVYIINES